MMYDFFILLFFIIFIGGCGFPSSVPEESLVHSNVTYYKKTFDTQNKALLIISGEIRGTLTNMDIKAAISGNKNMPKTWFWASYYANKKEPLVLMLSPGTYQLSDLQLYRFTSGSNYTKTSSLNVLKNGIEPIILNAGDVVYAGDIIIDVELANKKLQTYKINVSIGEAPSRILPFLQQYEKRTGKKVETRLMKRYVSEVK